MADYDGNLALLTTAYPDYQIHHYTATQQGWDSVTLLVNGDTIFRFARRPDVSKRLAREVALLPHLVSALPVAIPQFTHIGKDPAGVVSFVGYPVINGAPLSLEGRSAEQTQALAEQVADFLTALHRFPVREGIALGIPGGDMRDWREDRVAFSREVEEYIFPLLTEEEQAHEAARWRGYLANEANFAFESALIHRDLATEHILCDADSPRVSGVIDWGDVSVGDPAQDFTVLLRDLGAEFTRQALVVYQHEGKETYWERARFYLENGPLHTIRYGQHEENADIIQGGLADLRRRMSKLGNMQSGEELRSTR